MVSWHVPGALAPPTAYGPAADICITVVDGSTRTFAFPFADFLKIELKFVLHLDGNFTYV